MRIYNRIKKKMSEYLNRLAESNQKIFGNTRMKCCGLESSVKYNKK